jgi:predicted ribosomally synthesized peptide with SipW-like signal peptide
MKSRMLISMLVIALAAAVIGGATMAWFTDSDESTPVTFTAGTLLIDLTEPQLTQEFAEKDMGILNPGDTWEYEFEVKNVGTKSFNWGIYACWRDIVGQQNNALGEDQIALLKSKGYGTKGLSDVIRWEVFAVYGYGGKAQRLAEGLLPDVCPVATYMNAPLAANSAPVKFRIRASLPKDTSNDYQGSTMKFAIGVMAWQTTNDAPAPTLNDIKCPFDEGQHLHLQPAV